jgi:acetyl esterase/lipase
MSLYSIRLAAVCCLSLAAATAQKPAAPTTAADAPQRDTSYIDENGTAHVTRVVPVPTTLSPEARRVVARSASDQEPEVPLPQRRIGIAMWATLAAKNWSSICPNRLTDETMGGVPVHVVTPEGMPEANRDKVLLNLHGGGFDSDTGSYTESIPIAGYTKMKVVAALYRLAPENPYPAAVDDAIAVYKELLKSYKPEHIVIYGTSAGAILTAQVAVHIRALGLPLPAALGIFSGVGDFANPGDSVAIYTLRGFAGHLEPPAAAYRDSPYLHGANPADPLVSPIRADLKGMPPTLFVSSERDLLLSGTINLHRAFLRAGVDARLMVFDALPHAFWYDPELPESIEANHAMADFFVKALNR